MGGNGNMNMNKTGGGNGNAGNGANAGNANAGNANAGNADLERIRKLLEDKYGYTQSNFFINLTGPLRDQKLGENAEKGPGKIIKDNKTILNILSQTEEGDLERQNFNNCLQDVINILPENTEPYIWSVGGSSSQRMYPERKTEEEETDLTVQMGAKKPVDASKDRINSAAIKILEAENVVLFNAIGYQYDNVNNSETEQPYLDKDIKLINGGSFVAAKEKDPENCCKLLKKILELLRTNEYANKKVYLVKRNGKTDVDGSHLKQKHSDLNNIPGIEISSGQIKKIDSAGKVGYLYKDGRGNEEAEVFKVFNELMKDILTPANTSKTAQNFVSDVFSRVPSVTGGRRRRTRKVNKNRRKTMKAKKMRRKNKNKSSKRKKSKTSRRR